MRAALLLLFPCARASEAEAGRTFCEAATTQEAFLAPVRRALLTLAAEEWRRHSHLLEPPYSFACMADERLDNDAGNELRHNIAAFAARTAASRAPR